jgi:hypothetical protein
MLEYKDKHQNGSANGASARRLIPAGRVNSRSLNIFNGFERVPVNEKIPALN